MKITKDNEKWPYIPDHPYRIIIIGGPGSGKTNTLLNLIKEQDYHVIDKIYFYARDLSEPQHQFLIKKHEDAGIKNLNDPNLFIECSQIRWMMFTKTLIITTQKEIKKF